MRRNEKSEIHLINPFRRKFRIKWIYIDSVLWICSRVYLPVEAPKQESKYGQIDVSWSSDFECIYSTVEDNSNFFSNSNCSTRKSSCRSIPSSGAYMFSMVFPSSHQQKNLTSWSADLLIDWIYNRPCLNHSQYQQDCNSPVDITLTSECTWKHNKTTSHPHFIPALLNPQVVAGKTFHTSHYFPHHSNQPRPTLSWQLRNQPPAPNQNSMRFVSNETIEQKKSPPEKIKFQALKFDSRSEQVCKKDQWFAFSVGNCWWNR